MTPFGIPAATIQPMSTPGWTEAGTPPMAGPGLIEALVGAIATAGVVDFVTPVFLGDEPETTMVTPHILVRFGTGVPPTSASVFS